jgi:hypothetical protein
MSYAARRLGSPGIDAKANVANRRRALASALLGWCREAAA